LEGIVNPLSPLTYYRRHKRRALLLMALIALSTLGVCVMVRLLGSVTEQYEATESYLTQLSLAYARGDSFEPGVVSRLETHPDVARTIPARSLWVTVPLFGALPSDYPLFGVSEADLQELMDICDLRLREGRLPHSRSNEVVLSEELVDVLGLHVGDEISRSVDERAYNSLSTTMVLVGILEADREAHSRSKVLVGLASYEYLNSHEAYMKLPPELLVVAREGSKATVEQFLETGIASPRTEVWTQQRVSQSIRNALRLFYTIFGVVDGLVAVVIALVVGAINQIAMAQRIQDFGLLHALGQRKNWLVRQLALEMAAVAGAGWLAGLGLSWLVFWWLRENVYNSAAELSLANLTPAWFAVPIPLVAIAIVTLGTRRTLARLDAVAIVDRGTVAAEGAERQKPAGHTQTPRSSVRPLSSWIFYWRHRRRGMALMLTIALMILGVAFPVFLFAPMIDTDRLRYEYLRRITVLSPVESAAVDPGVTAQVRLHPDVARVVPAIRLGLLIDVPPLNRNNVTIFGVSEEDMLALLDVYGVQLEEGRLPEPRSNEIAVSRGIAINRGLEVGDQVGKPVYDLDHDMPTEMEVVGIISRPESDPHAQDLWLGFASYAYLRSHELYASRPVDLLLLPEGGRRAELDAWLEETVSSEQIAVRTYEKLQLMHQRDVRMLLLLVTVVEGILAVVAALALAILSHIFFIQRQEEFGILSALGRSRRWLVLRTVGETVAVVVVAWLLGAVICLAGLVFMQVALFAPKGMSLDFASPAPWVSTIPLPLAIIAVGAMLVVWMLSRLDPVSIIERR
jgi:ABC-type antimicrobial peptide transport system permease subunit